MVDLLEEDPRVGWILWLAVFVAFLLAFSVGANDVSNSFGTSVGSGVLTVTQACILATIFEVAGATLLGHSVCDFFRNNMYNADLYKDSYDELMIGALGCLVGSALWNFVATKLKMPISGTHSVIGATLGFNLVLRGSESIQWKRIGLVVASWFISPLMSGIISSTIYLFISKNIIAQSKPLDNGLKALPFFYGATIFINVASLTIFGPDIFGINKLPWYAGLAIALMASALTICYTALRVKPQVRIKILNEMESLKNAKQPPTPPEIKVIEHDAPEPEPKPEPELTVKETCEQVDDADANKEGQVNRAFNDEAPEANQPETTETINAKKTLDESKQPILQRQLARDCRTVEEDEEEGDDHEPDVVHNQKGETENGIELQIIGQTMKSNHEDDHEQPQTTQQQQSSKLIAGERIEVFRLFSSLQILTACFASFAHGTNDVSNAVAPLVPIWNIWETGKEDPQLTTQAWLLLFGGIGICAGLWAWGRAVMRTVGTGLTELTPSKGFSIELGAAISVLLASKIGIPISTTHCKVGSLVILAMVSERFCSDDGLRGLSRGARRLSRLWAEGILSDEEELSSGKVDWKLFGNIAITWIVTVPLSAMAAALATVILRALAPTLT